MKKYTLLCKIEIINHKNISNGFFKYLIPLEFICDDDINENSQKLYKEIIKFFKTSKDNKDFYVIKNNNIKSISIIDKKIEFLNT